MQRLFLAIVVFACATLAACSGSSPTPTRPDELLFAVVGTSGEGFQVVDFKTSNGPVHTIAQPCSKENARNDFTSPYAFFLLNAQQPVRGTFQRAVESSDCPAPSSTTSPVPLQLYNFGFNTSTPFRSGEIPPDSDLPVSLATSAQEIKPVNGPDVRVEVCDQDQTPPISNLCSDQVNQQPIPFTASIGDEVATFIACSFFETADTGRPAGTCGTPAIFYLEAPQSFAVAFVANQSPNTGDVVLVNLYINGVLQGTDTASTSNRNAKVQFRF
ncbi:MAG: hypothetical protein HYR72_23595 [Deltaproteobacteria bacterium]|nr:hypothetical protein [Deltaproteobacteria bacterium]MBI3389085.1 hypothetical protein [Deltaproteobacteria bacterium]